MNQNVFLWDRTSEAENSKRMSNLFFVLAILVGLVLIFLEPPFVCPDENAHYINICRISHGGLFADVQDGRVGSLISDEELDFFNRYAGAYNGVGNVKRFDYQTMQELSAREASKEMIFLPNDFSTLNSTVYLLPSAVLAFFAPVHRDQRLQQFTDFQDRQSVFLRVCDPLGVAQNRGISKHYVFTFVDAHVNFSGGIHFL